MIKREPSFLLPVLFLLSLAACKTTGEQKAQSDSDWLMASPILAQQIQDEAARLPWTHGFERLEQIRWFALVGEPVYDTLLELAEDPRDDVASAALAALGDTQDRRLVPYIHRLSWEESRLTGDLGLERARTLLRLGDWSEIPTLIRGLKDERQYTRSLCIQALQGATGETFGFDPKADLTDRVRAIDSWEVWWRARTGEGLLGKRDA
jgi:HEAT repeat protein